MPRLLSGAQGGRDARLPVQAGAEEGAQEVRQAVQVPQGPEEASGAHGEASDADG